MVRVFVAAVAGGAVRGRPGQQKRRVLAQSIHQIRRNQPVAPAGTGNGQLPGRQGLALLGTDINWPDTAVMLEMKALVAIVGDFPLHHQTAGGFFPRLLLPLFLTTPVEGAVPCPPVSLSLGGSRAGAGLLFVRLAAAPFLALLGAGFFDRLLVGQTRFQQLIAKTVTHGRRISTPPGADYPWAPTGAGRARWTVTTPTTTITRPTSARGARRSSKSHQAIRTVMGGAR